MMEDKDKSKQAQASDNQPLWEMIDMLADAGVASFQDHGNWERCLCSLILKLNPTCPKQEILEALPHDRNTYDETDVLNTMANLGYYGRQEKCLFSEIEPRLLPGLFISDKNIPYIVIGVDSRKIFRVFDPVKKQVTLMSKRGAQRGRFWFFQPYDATLMPTSKFMRKGSNHSWFRALTGRFKGTFAQIMTAGLILNLIALTTPFFIMLVYDRIIAAGVISPLPVLALGTCIAVIFEWKLRDIRSQGLSWLAGRLDNIVSNRIFAHLIGLPPALIEKASVAAQIARIKTFESVRDFFSGSVFLSLLEAPFVILSMVAIAFIAGPLVFVPIVIIFGYLAIFAFVRRRVKVVIRLAAKNSSARQQFTIETFEKLHGIRAAGLGSEWQKKFRHLSGREMMSHFHLGWLGMIAETCANALTVMSAVMTVGFGVHLIWENAMTTGALVASMILVWRILTPFYSLCTMIPRLEQLRNSIEQVNNLMDIDTEAEAAKAQSRLSNLRGSIDFTNVEFRYDDGDYIFKHLGFKVKPGDVVAVTGGMGRGKSTILKLIKGLYTAQSGAVSIDGFDVRQLDAPDLRQKIAYVPKIPRSFQGTIYENLRFANLTASAERIRKALMLADAWEDVNALPQGLNTVIGQGNNAGLSPELEVKLSLARAYLHPGKILLIDELPNTLLSSQAGQNLKDYLLRSKGKRTILIVTYRNDYLNLADTIVYLQGIEKPICGPRDEILAVLNTQKETAA